MLLRTRSRACSSCVLPATLSVAKGAIAEQLPAWQGTRWRPACHSGHGLDRQWQSRECSVLPRTGIALVAPMVSAPGGRMEGATTSKRSNLREPFGPPDCAVAAREVNMYTGSIPLASQDGLVPPGESCSVWPSQQTLVSSGAPLWLLIHKIGIGDAVGLHVDADPLVAQLRGCAGLHTAQAIASSACLEQPYTWSLWRQRRSCSRGKADRRNTGCLGPWDQPFHRRPGSARTTHRQALPAIS